MIIPPATDAKSIILETSMIGTPLSYRQFSWSQSSQLYTIPTSIIWSETPGSVP